MKKFIELTCWPLKYNIENKDYENISINIMHIISFYSTKNGSIIECIEEKEYQVMENYEAVKKLIDNENVYIVRKDNRNIFEGMSEGEIKILLSPPSPEPHIKDCICKSCKEMRNNHGL